MIDLCMTLNISRYGQKKETMSFTRHSRGIKYARAKMFGIASLQRTVLSMLV